ncbi:dihydroxyacetone kinase 1 [Rhizoctonia solani AG-1 IA]|uniref:Dihydroxyacetone kinase 1 n=1 Tax=Thanatephorus cucumeris (strain AG1-IA) TaxID=983506 RepID=L8WZP5_THACA|nr:dihydroxyacetone kinase 1 [Rhizoctonia solani AG-1 IA]
MPGFSVTLLLLPQSDETKVSKDKLLRLLDAPAKTPAWTWTSGASPITRSSVASPQAEASTQKGSTPASNQFSDSVRRACHALIRAEPEITQMDQIVGDGDCGTTLKAGAEAVLDALNKPEFAFYGARGSISQIGQIVGDAMGGTSGALYSIYISALAQGLQGASSGDSGEPTRGQYADAAAFALERLYTYTRARPPSRTLVDPLAAFVESLKDPDAHLEQAFEAAQRAAEETKNLPARAGRAAYVNAEAVKGTCDPGAWGIRCLLEGLRTTCMHLLNTSKKKGGHTRLLDEVQMTFQNHMRKAMTKVMRHGGYSTLVNSPLTAPALHTRPAPTLILGLLISDMHTIARASSFASLPSGSNSALTYPYHHQPPPFGRSNHSQSAPSTPSEQFPPPVMPNFGPSIEVATAQPTTQPGPPSTPARGCLKAPSKEFTTKSEPEVQIISPTSGRHAPGIHAGAGDGSTRRRPNMKLERLPSSAIARIQLAEGVEPHAHGGKNATNSGGKGKCKERVPTPYVKSDKTGWLSDGEE